MKFVTLENIKNDSNTKQETVNALISYQYGVKIGLSSFLDLDILCDIIDWCVTTFKKDCYIVIESQHYLIFDSEDDQSYFLLKWS